MRRGEQGCGSSSQLVVGLAFAHPSTWPVLSRCWFCCPIAGIGLSPFGSLNISMGLSISLEASPNGKVTCTPLVHGAGLHPPLFLCPSPHLCPLLLSLPLCAGCQGSPCSLLTPPNCLHQTGPSPPAFRLAPPCGPPADLALPGEGVSENCRLSLWACPAQARVGRS